MFSIDEYDQVLIIGMGRTVLGREVFRTNAFHLDGLLIDTGLPHYRDKMIQTIERRGLNLIINTHCHRACIGNNLALQRNFSVPIKAHKEALERIKYPEKASMIQKWLWGQAEPSKVSKLKNSLNYGGYYFRIIETIGCDRGHICLHEPDRKWLFCGDLLAKNPAAVNQVARVQLERDLEKLINLDPQIIFCRHNGIITNGKIVLEARVKSLKQGRRNGPSAAMAGPGLSDFHTT